MIPPGWPEGMCDPDDAEFPDRATRWLWDVGAVPRELDSVWSRQPRALAFRVGHDLRGRLDGTRTAYSRARQELGGTGVSIEAVLSALEAEAADLQGRIREVGLVGEALAGLRWRDRL